MNIKKEKQGKLGANCYLISTDTAAVQVDGGVFTDTVKEFWQENKDKEKLIIVTHRHFDHIGGLYEAAEFSGAKIAVHSIDACGFTNLKDSLAERFHTSYNLRNPDILLNDGNVLSVGDLAVNVIHTPGHTEGSVCLLIENFMFSGDTLFRGGVGRTNLPTGSDAMMCSSLLKLINLDRDYTVYPGHGEATTLYYEKQYNPYIPVEK